MDPADARPGWRRRSRRQGERDLPPAGPARRCRRLPQCRRRAGADLARGSLPLRGAGGDGRRPARPSPSTRSGGIPDLLRGDTASARGALWRRHRDGGGRHRRAAGAPEEITRADARARRGRASASTGGLCARPAGAWRCRTLPAVSAVVPNYNYARYMPERLGSIFAQTHPVREVIVLDDCSTDDSLEVIPHVAAAAGARVRLVPNESNSRLGLRAVAQGGGAGAGRVRLDRRGRRPVGSRTSSRATVALMAADPAICLAFADSRTIHADGSAQWDSYKGYYATRRARRPGADRGVRGRAISSAASSA